MAGVLPSSSPTAVHDGPHDLDSATKRKKLDPRPSTVSETPDTALLATDGKAPVSKTAILDSSPSYPSTELAIAAFVYYCNRASVTQGPALAGARYLKVLRSMPVLDAESLTPADVVWRRIRRDWRDDIVVVDKGEEDGQDWVEIGCTSRIACEQARISLASFVRNDREDWRSGWSVAEGDALPYRLRLIDPTLQGHEEAAA